ELLDGQPLDRALERGIDEARSLRIGKQVVAAVAYAHSKGLVHRDLKPGNIFLTRGAEGEETARVLDFGLAKFVDHAARKSGPPLTKTGAIMGTPAYMSP